jgi:hypothetical protein
MLLTCILLDAPPLLGDPASSTHVVRVYRWLALSRALSLVLALLSLLCKWCLSANHVRVLVLRMPGPANYCSKKKRI